MKTFKKGLNMLSYNFSSIILFEVIYKLISAVILVPALYASINMSIKLAGINFLSIRTLKKYLFSPTTYVAILIMLVILAVYFLINISAIVYAMEASHREIKINALHILVKATVNALRLLRPKNLLVMLDVIFVLPLVYASIIFSSIYELKVPTLFYDFIEKNRQSFIMICIAYLLMCILAMFKLLTINFYGIYRTDYKTSADLSRKTIKKHYKIGLCLIKQLKGSLHGKSHSACVKRVSVPHYNVCIVEFAQRFRCPIFTVVITDDEFKFYIGISIHQAFKCLKSLVFSVETGRKTHNLCLFVHLYFTSGIITLTSKMR